MATAATAATAGSATIPASLKAHLTKILANKMTAPGTNWRGTPPPSAATAATVDYTVDAASLIEALLAAAPAASEHTNVNSWANQQVGSALGAIEKDPRVAIGLGTGTLGLLEAAARNTAHTALYKSVYDTMNGHHREFRAITAAHATTTTCGTAAEVGIKSPQPCGSATDKAYGSPHVGPAIDPVIDDAWQLATADQDALRAYAAAATHIGAQEWVRTGIAWMASMIDEYFGRDTSGPSPDGTSSRPHGELNLTRRLAAKLSYDTRQAPLSTEEELVLMTALRSERASGPPARRVRLLDVGACGTLFDAHPAIDDTAIDLCPQAGNARVLQSDFLKLRISGPGSEPTIEPCDEFAAGRLTELPEGSYDVVALSLVLSYLPRALQRGAMIRKARRLLPTPDPPRIPSCTCGGDTLTSTAPSTASITTTGMDTARACACAPRLSRGLLLVVDTMSIDGRHATRRSGGFIQEWIESIEAEGFVHLRHKVLSKSHALAFATAPLPCGWVEGSMPPPPLLRMKREERGDWDDGLLLAARN